MLESGFDPKFVAGMLGNICYEGNVGLFEYYNSSQDYMQYMQNHYSYKSNYSGKYIYNVNLNNVYNMLKQIMILPEVLGVLTVQELVLV